jgi:low temperature requirement protein LtrA
VARVNVDGRRRVLRAGDDRVTNIELFFDLVYVFAVTQLSHLLVDHPTVDGAVQTAVLLAVVWQVWIYTMWVTTYVNPNLGAVRAMLVLIMFGSLVLAAAIPHAFDDRGMLVAVAFAVMHVGRSIFAAWILRDHELRLVFQRAGTWCVLSSALMILGATVHGHARELLWAAAIATDLIGAAFGFFVPGLGRSTTTDWTIEGGHFAERCQAFVIIALGESIVVTGATLSGLVDPGGDEIAAFVLAFAASVALWWVYFDRAADDSLHVIAESDDPGRLGRSAFHQIHPIIVAGIIVAAAADEVVLEMPGDVGHTSTTWLVLGGTALYLGGHALFKAVVWRIVPWSRVLGVVAMAALLPVAPHVSALTLGVITLVVVVAVAGSDRIQHPASFG